MTGSTFSGRAAGLLALTQGRGAPPTADSAPVVGGAQRADRYTDFGLRCHGARPTSLDRDLPSPSLALPALKSGLLPLPSSGAPGTLDGHSHQLEHYSISEQLGVTCLAVIPTQPSCPSSEGNPDLPAPRGAQCSPPPFLESHLYHSQLAWVNISSQSLPTKKEGLTATSTPHNFAPAPSRSPWRLPCSQV